jgi:hypothetical protein
MTRSVEAIEADLAAARQDHQAAVEARGQARYVARTLKERAIAGDASVSAQDLALANDVAYHAELPLESKLEAIKPLEVELKKAQAARVKDGWVATDTALLADFEQAMADGVAVDDRIAVTWRLLAAHRQQVTTEVYQHGLVNVIPEIKEGVRGVVLGGREMRAPAVVEPLARNHQKRMQRLQGGQPKAMR